jgi:hypothetical protein
LDPVLIEQVEANIGLRLGKAMPTPEVTLREDGDAIIVDGVEMEKPFVEKPVSGEDHNVYIYFKGGSGRRLFRKVHQSNFKRGYNSLTLTLIQIGNQSSELDPTLSRPRTDGSYIYEEFIDVDNCKTHCPLISISISNPSLLS